MTQLKLAGVSQCKQEIYPNKFRRCISQYTHPGLSPLCPTQVLHFSQTDGISLFSGQIKDIICFFFFPKFNPVTCHNTYSINTCWKWYSNYRQHLLNTYCVPGQGTCFGIRHTLGGSESLSGPENAYQQLGKGEDGNRFLNSKSCVHSTWYLF